MKSFLKYRYQKCVLFLVQIVIMFLSMYPLLLYITKCTTVHHGNSDLSSNPLFSVIFSLPFSMFLSFFCIYLMPIPKRITFTTLSSFFSLLFSAIEKLFTCIFFQTEEFEAANASVMRMIYRMSKKSSQVFMACTPWYLYLMVNQNVLRTDEEE